MKIAITSQNRKSITGHAGKCRNFWIYQLKEGQLANKKLVELAIDQSFHASHHEMVEPLAQINVLITGSMGGGLYQRLMQQGIQPIITSETNPDEAIAAFLENRLERLPFEANHHH
jgi:predicted Fe-Mo cluster-binding NifX family protein